MINWVACVGLLSISLYANDQAENKAETLKQVEKIFAEHRLDLQFENGKISGPGADLLIQRSRDSLFVSVGESHYSVQTPRLLADLFRQIKDAGYQYLAIENGPLTTELLNDLLAQKDSLAASRRFLTDYFYSYPFYDSVDEFYLLQEVTRHSQEQRPIWGLDQEFAYSWRYFLDRLALLAEDKQAKAFFASQAQKAKAIFEDALRTMDTSKGFSRGLDAAFMGELRRQVTRDNNPEMLAILAQLEKTTSIYTSGGLASLEERCNFFRENFDRNVKQVVARTGEAPKVMLKTGSVHALRGLSSNGNFDIGNHVSELAHYFGSRSFHLLILGFVFEQDEGSGLKLVEDAPAYKLLLGDADPSRFHVIDFESARARLRPKHYEALTPHLANRVRGYDAFVIAPILNNTNRIVSFESMVQAAMQRAK